MLQPLIKSMDLSKFYFSNFAKVDINGAHCFLTRTGYTGEKWACRPSHCRRIICCLTAVPLPSHHLLPHCRPTAMRRSASPKARP